MDNTPPQNRLIAFYSALAVLLLIGLVPAFHAYFDNMSRDTIASHLETHSDLGGVTAAQDEWQRRLSSGRVPIGEAMSQLSQRGRTAFPQIQPQPSTPMNVLPLQGWNQLPQEVPANVAAPATEPAPGTSPEGVPAEGVEAAPTDGAPEAAAAEAAAAEAAAAEAAAAAAAAAEAAAPRPAAPRPARPTRPRPARPAPADDAPAAAPVAPAPAEGE